MLGHVLDPNYISSIYPTYKDILIGIRTLIYSFHMPLFFMLSGYVYEMAYFQKSDADDSNKSRFRYQIIRLIYLYVLWDVILGVFKVLLSKYTYVKISVWDIVMIPVRSIQLYWYLYALIIFYLIFAAECLRKLHKVAIFLIMLILSALSGILPNVSWLNLSNVMHFGVFFYTGILIRGLHKDRYAAWNRLMNIGAIIFAASAICIDIFQFMSGNNTNLICELICAFGASLLLWIIFSKIHFSEKSFLSYVGNHCLEIYLLHTFFIAIFRTGFMKIGIENAAVSISLNMILSIAASLLAAEVARKMKIYDLFYNGKMLTDRIRKKYR